MTQQTVLEIWTDGACKGNPGPGGWGVLMRFGAHSHELYGGEAQTTNNRMELTAVIEALSAIKRPVPIILHLDSSYVRNGITGWIHSWKKKAGAPPTANPSKTSNSGKNSMNLQAGLTLTGAGSRGTRETSETNEPTN